jgi:hypothetical protein
MFVELLPILRNRSVMLTLALVRDKAIGVNVFRNASRTAILVTTLLLHRSLRVHRTSWIGNSPANWWGSRKRL